MVICALLPRFELRTALGDRRTLLGRPLALAPEPGSVQAVGEVSGPAEAHGIHAGMRLGEALARCPQLLLVPGDRARAEAAWEQVLRLLEGIGAAVEPGRVGEVFFDADGLRRLWGDTSGVMSRARRAIGMPARLGAAPSRFCAYVAAGRTRPRGKPIIVKGSPAEFLAPQSVSLLRGWVDSLPDQLEQLGIRTLGELAAMPSSALADRFGKAGLQAKELALGGGEILRPRSPGETVAEQLELPEASSGFQLERALELLIHRLLANPARRNRSFRRLRLSATLAAGGSWSSDVPLRRASASRGRLGLALRPVLSRLPGPAEGLRLAALALGPPVRDQLSLTGEQRERRRERLGEAVRQVRAAAGRNAVLRVLDLDPASRIPERRLMLAPW
jgi:nucleotidyltransferase/DNA polymerase involved in DNA repair